MKTTQNNVHQKTFGFSTNEKKKMKINTKMYDMFQKIISHSL